MANKNLNKAKKAKNDEFYTQLSDIEKELKYYKQYFKDKIIFCNCDDPEWSNFYKYFYLNFEELGLKKLICTHYDKEEPTYKLVIEKDINGDGKIDEKDTVPIRLEGNGDFRNAECIELLKEADIVITNPPFSLFGEYLTQLLEYDKKFIIIGNFNAITNLINLIKENKLWLGVSPRGMEFRVPKEYVKLLNNYREENGQIIAGSNACWYTNLDHNKRHEKLILWKKYNPTEFPTYDNYDAIEISKVVNIPIDYKPCWYNCIYSIKCKYAQTEGNDEAFCESNNIDIDKYSKQASKQCKCNGLMGVPITFFDKYCPEQFEILGGSGDFANPVYINGKKGSGRFYINNKRLYERIIIRHKKD